ncbi:MAG: 16S rRNA (adenine(1518)-N(6)/adenine(1519)-N(6))-dimethyltransferase RsmA [Chloroflexota bacterium]
MTAPVGASPDRGRPSRLDPAAVRRTLADAGLRARKGLSQNFLADVDVLEAILAEAAPAPGRRILEIGPGLGILTAGLLEAGAAVTAVELDEALAARLRSQLVASIDRAADDPTAPGALTLIEGNALDQHLVGLVAPPYDVVANLPYHITSPILHRLLGEPPRADRLVLMVQREVAERIAAQPGAMSYLSVFVQVHARARVAFRVAREAFEPAPKVESAVLVLETYDALAPPAADEDDLWRLVQAGFRERRKMIRNVLARQLPVPASRVEDALAEVGIAGDRRPQTLSVEDWRRLQSAFGPLPTR